MRVAPRPRPTFPLLCVIAREQITAAPTIDNFEWAERIKDRLLALGFTYPDPPHRMTEAMDAVERALVKVWGPRPAPLPPRTPSETREVLRQVDPPWPRSGRGDQPWMSLKALLANLKGSPSSGNSSGT